MVPPKQMTTAHKEAMAAGRKEGQAVKAYLDAIQQQRPRRGRRRTRDSIAKRLAAIEQQLPDASSLKQLQLVQERRDLQAELDGMGGDGGSDLSALEADFVKVAKAYAARKSISYASWRDLGVSADVLKQAGIGRGA
jgi:hypothetical protein